MNQETKTPQHVLDNLRKTFEDMGIALHMEENGNVFRAGLSCHEFNKVGSLTTHPMAGYSKAHYTVLKTKDPIAGPQKFYVHIDGVKGKTVADDDLKKLAMTYPATKQASPSPAS